MTEQRFPEQRFLEDVDYDDAAIGEMLFNVYREKVHHSQREGLSVGQSSSSVSDRSGQPVVNSDKDHGPNQRSQGMINVLNNIERVPSNVHFSH